MGSPSFPFDEGLIERYVRFPHTLDDETRSEVAALIRMNPQARAVAEFYREYYDHLDQVDDAARRGGGDTPGYASDHEDTSEHEDASDDEDTPESPMDTG